MPAMACLRLPLRCIIADMQRACRNGCAFFIEMPVRARVWPKSKDRDAHKAVPGLPENVPGKGCGMGQTKSGIRFYREG